MGRKSTPVHTLDSLQIPVFIPQAGSRATGQAQRALLKAGFQVLLGTGVGKRARVSGMLGTQECAIEHPCPIRNQQAFRDWLSARMTEQPQECVLPIDEAVIHAVIPLVATSALKQRIVLPSEVSLAASLSKFHATRMAHAAEIAIPQTCFIREPGTRKLEFDQDWGTFPKLLKWDNAVSPEGGYEKGANRIVRSRDEMEACCAELEPLDCGIMLQELVPGAGVGAFFLRHRGEIVLRFAHRRVHEFPWTGGVSAYCESSDDAEVLEAGEKLLEAIDYEGVAMVEFRKEPGKAPVFLEINGRLWGSLGLALAAGANFPVAMVECHLHGKTTVSQPDISRKIRWHEPGLEMDYHRTLWTKAPGPVDGPAPRVAGSLRVFGNFLDPRVKSDWWKWSDLPGSAKRYLKLAHREAAWIKSLVRKRLFCAGQDPLVVEAANRTRQWLCEPGSPKKILFLCYGNICRSPYAEYRWNEMRRDEADLPIANSSGFHENTDRETPSRFQSVARYLGVDLRNHRSRRVDQKQLAEADVIFVMDARNLRDLLQEFPEAESRVLLLGALGEELPEIPDPYGKEIGAGGAVYRRIDRELEQLQSLLKEVS